MKLIATKKHEYAGKVILPGETYEAEQRDVETLVAHNVATIAEEKKSKGGRYSRKDLRAEE